MSPGFISPMIDFTPDKLLNVPEDYLRLEDIGIVVFDVQIYEVYTEIYINDR